MTDTAVTPPADWRLAIPEERRAHLRTWFWAVAAMTFSVLVVGGITRLTHSGLSIVDWDPILGVIPPLNHHQWLEAFERYQQFPEYQQLRQGMTLGDFQSIFFWEYLHRLLARSIGLVFLLPFLFFWLRGYFNRPLATRALVLFGLGLGQGVMGWFMVASGLVDRPSVSHFRLAAHLSLAFTIFGFSVWMARELTMTPLRMAVPADTKRRVLRRVWLVGVVLALQVVWGAFTAGLKAGHYDNTFPLMEGHLVPPSLYWLQPTVLNFFQNPVGVQWTHRVIGTLLLLAVMGAALAMRRPGVDRGSRRYAMLFLGLVAVQYLLGIATLLLVVPVPLAVTHQATAMVIFGVWVSWLHHARGLGDVSAGAGAVRTGALPSRHPFAK